MISLAEQVEGAERVHSSALRTMQAHDHGLKSLVDQYLRVVREGVWPQVACFYEQLPTNIAAVVHKDVSPGHRVLDVH